jgi:DNA polymerase III sliding clamp (beta) subunit (PCNA family)
LATNGVIGIRYQNPISLSLEEFVLPSEIFSRVLSSFPVDAEVDLTKQEKFTVIKIGKTFRAKFPNLEDEGINIDIPPEEAKIQLPDGYGDCLRQLLFSIPKDDKTKESLRGIYYNGKSFYASDNIKLSRITSNFDQMTSELFIPTQLLDHLTEDKPLAYCITDTEGLDRLLWFWFKDYVIFCAIKGTVFPIREEVFDKFVDEKNSVGVVVSANREELKEKVDRISIIADQYKYRINIIALQHELILYTLLPNGMDAIEFLPITSSVKDGDKAGFVAVDINYLKEEIERCSDLSFTEDFIYFNNKEGLESILKSLGVEDGPVIMEKVGEYYNNRRDSGATVVGS